MSSMHYFNYSQKSNLISHVLWNLYRMKLRSKTSISVSEILKFPECQFGFRRFLNFIGKILWLLDRTSKSISFFLFFFNRTLGWRHLTRGTSYYSRQRIWRGTWKRAETKKTEKRHLRERNGDLVDPSTVQKNEFFFFSYPFFITTNKK